MMYGAGAYAIALWVNESKGGCIEVDVGQHIQFVITVITGMLTVSLLGVVKKLGMSEAFATSWLIWAPQSFLNFLVIGIS